MVKADHLVVIGGSAGSYNLIVDMLGALPKVFTAAVVVVIHRNAKYKTRIEETLSNRLSKRIIPAADKAVIQANSIYFASPGYHLFVEPDLTFSLDISDLVLFSRPSIDVLFDSAADVYTQRCAGFLLSGANRDGTQGITHIQKMGGQAFIQHPEDALITTMPESAIENNNSIPVLHNPEIIAYFANIK